MQAIGLQDALRTQASPFLADVLSELEIELTLELVMDTEDDDVAVMLEEDGCEKDVLDDERIAGSDELILTLEEDEPVRFARMLGEAMTMTVAVKTIARTARTSVVCLCICIRHMVRLIDVFGNMVYVTD